MNARQKAKKYKKELDRLRSLPFIPQIIREERPVMTLRASVIEDPKYSLLPKDFIYKKLIEEIGKSDEFINAVIFDSRYIDWTGQTRYTATLRVVGR